MARKANLEKLFARITADIRKVRTGFGYETARNTLQGILAEVETALDDLEALPPYRPSNSDDGAHFERVFCQKCAAGTVSETANIRCTHLAKALFGEQNGVWVWENDRPVCKAFRPRKRKISARKPDKRQINLFQNVI